MLIMKNGPIPKWICTNIKHFLLYSANLRIESLLFIILPLRSWTHGEASPCRLSARAEQNVAKFRLLYSLLRKYESPEVRKPWGDMRIFNKSHKELCNPFSRISNSFPRIGQLVLSDCNSFPRIRQYVFSNCNPLLELDNSFSRIAIRSLELMNVKIEGTNCNPR